MDCVAEIKSSGLKCWLAIESKTEDGKCSAPRPRLQQLSINLRRADVQDQLVLLLPSVVGKKVGFLSLIMGSSLVTEVPLFNDATLGPLHWTLLSFILIDLNEPPWPPSKT